MGNVACRMRMMTLLRLLKLSWERWHHQQWTYRVKHDYYNLPPLVDDVEESQSVAVDEDWFFVLCRHRLRWCVDVGLPMLVVILCGMWMPWWWCDFLTPCRHLLGGAHVVITKRGGITYMHAPTYSKMVSSTILRSLPLSTALHRQWRESLFNCTSVSTYRSHVSMCGCMTQANCPSGFSRHTALLISVHQSI